MIRKEFPDKAPCAAPTFYRTYSRVKKDGSKESYEEVIERTIRGLRVLRGISEKDLESIAQAQREVKVTTSGRWMWVGGTEWLDKADNKSGAFNCLRSGTQIFTKEGVLNIEDLVGRASTVLNRLGQWTEVEFKSYGLDKLLTVNLKSNRKVKTVYATPNHRWFVDGKVIETKDLEIGHSLKRVYAQRPSLSSKEDLKDYNFGVLHGCYYADGSASSNKRGTEAWQYQLRLCGSKAKLLELEAFEAAHVIYPPSCGGDPITYAMSYPSYYISSGDLKSLPSTESLPYILGFLRGVLALDGSSYKGGVCFYGSKELIEFASKYCPLLGIRVCEAVEYNNNTNYGPRKDPMYCLSLGRDSLVDEDFLREEHLTNFSSVKARESRWTVVSVEDESIFEEVFCCEEPSTTGFVLSDDLETGNCTSLYLDNKEQFFLTLDLLGQGSGVGAVIEREGLDKLEPIKYKTSVSGLSEDDIGCKYGTKFQPYPESTELFDMDREDSLLFNYSSNQLLLVVGDSRLGWVDAYRKLWSVFIGKAVDSYGDTIPAQNYHVFIDYSFVRPEGTPIKGFGGKAQPSGLPHFLNKVCTILNQAVDAEGILSTKQASLLCCEGGKAIVAGGVRRCLPVGTKVSTKDGYKYIEYVKIGDEVTSINGYRKVTNVFDQGRQNLYQVDTDQGSFRCTSDHKVWVDTNKGPEWVKAKDLLKGYVLRKNVEGTTNYDLAYVERSFLTTYSAHTYDIEVEEDHAFYADGFLVSNSAEWHGFDSSDTEGNSCKENLWVEVDGKWSIDPDRDAFRMANHTRIFHHQPTLDEIRESVAKQHASGEGAIMFAPESIARCSNDILPTREAKDDFINTYVKSKDKAREKLSELIPNASEYEIEHRMGRYLANPCYAPGTIVLTKKGYFRIESLIHQRRVEVWDGENWIKAAFKQTGVDQDVMKITMTSGEEIVATPYHTFILADGTRTELSELKPGDRLMTHEQIYHGEHEATDAEIEEAVALPKFPIRILNWNLSSKERFLDAFLHNNFSLVSSNKNKLILKDPSWAQGMFVLYRSIGTYDMKISLLEDKELKGIIGYDYEYIIERSDSPVELGLIKSIEPFGKSEKVYCCNAKPTHRMSLPTLITGQCVK